MILVFPDVHKGRPVDGGFLEGRHFFYHGDSCINQVEGERTAAALAEPHIHEEHRLFSELFHGAGEAGLL